MPQFTAFPYLPPGDPRTAVGALVTLCRDFPADGEPFRELRRRMRALRLWDRERATDTLRFLHVAATDPARPSELVRAVASARKGEALDLLAGRLWDVNPLLGKTIVERLVERVYPPKELYSLIASHAYRGKPIAWQQFESWLGLARGLELLKLIGVAFGLDERGHGLVTRASELDVDEFLEEDVDEPEIGGLPDGLGAGEAAPEPAAAHEAPAAIVGSSRSGAAAPPARSPRGRERPIPVGAFAGTDVFPDEVLAETRRRIAAWWDEEPSPAEPLGAADFGIGSESWMEGAEESLYRIAVAAALVFRLDRDRGAVIAAYAGLDQAGVLADLYHGTAPETLTDRVDARALMLASLVARRFGETPDLAAALEREKGAAETFARLEAALGRGLFKVELFWIVRQLSDLGAIRRDGLADFAAVPHRAARDALFRLGFLATPYAHDSGALAAAAAAARAAAGNAGPADEVLAAFAAAAGCAYDCEHRRSCEYACRERWE